MERNSGGDTLNGENDQNEVTYIISTGKNGLHIKKRNNSNTLLVMLYFVIIQYIVSLVLCLCMLCCNKKNAK